MHAFIYPKKIIKGTLIFFLCVYTNTKIAPQKRSRKEIKIINRERKFLIYAHNNHSVMGILTLHSQNRLGRSILDACMQREKCLPYFYVKILQPKSAFGK